MTAGHKMWIIPAVLRTAGCAVGTAALRARKPAPALAEAPGRELASASRPRARRHLLEPPPHERQGRAACAAEASWPPSAPPGRPDRRQGLAAPPARPLAQPPAW